MEEMLVSYKPELRMLTSMVDREQLLEKIKEEFKEVDKNQDGKISLEECKIAAEKIFEEMFISELSE